MRGVSRIVGVLGISLLALGCGSDPANPDDSSTGGTSGTGGSGGTTPSKDVPADTTQAGIEAFLAALDYRTATWASVMSGPTEPAPSIGSPHGLVQIWYNKALRQSKADGHTGMQGDAHATGSMVVKELYTGSDVIGHALLLRQDSGWLYYCAANEPNRCSVSIAADKVTYTTSALSCACHSSGTIISTADIPPP
jgi:hypothetical protein